MHLPTGSVVTVHESYGQFLNVWMWAAGTEFGQTLGESYSVSLFRLSCFPTNEASHLVIYFNNLVQFLKERNLDKLKRVLKWLDFVIKYST